MFIKRMKFQKLFWYMAIILGIAYPSKAADISVLNFTGDLLGKVIPNGSVVNFNNELIGRINAEGLVLNDENDLIGGIIPQGVAISYNNTILGKVNSDGTVTSENEVFVGKVLPNGLVVDNNYNVLGGVISPGLVYNDLGNIVGRVAGNGKFYDLSGENSGYTTADGYVYSKSTSGNTELIGKLINSKIVVNSKGAYLGSITPDGKIIDKEKKIIGHIEANGYAYNEDKQAIGHIVEKSYAFSLDGKYIGQTDYNGDVINKDKSIAKSVISNRVLDNSNQIIGFTINMQATANALDGSFLGYISQNGNIVKGRTVVGNIGASGNVIDKSGKTIGKINESGPIYDYLGQLKASASINGQVVSLEGIDLGYMQGEKAYDRNDNEIGQIIKNKLLFDNNNEFIGISGISSLFETKQQKYKISPYGYILGETSVIGNNIPLAEIMDKDGNILAYPSLTGQTENKSLNEVSKLLGNGLLLDKNNQPLGKTLQVNYITDFLGKSLGYSNAIGEVVNEKNNVFAKVLPDNKIVSRAKDVKIYGMAGEPSVALSINGDFLGYIFSDGAIKKNKNIIGKVSSSQYVLDNTGALYGKAIPFGAVISKQCEFIGIVADNGEARTLKGAYLGMVLANGQVVSDDEVVLGYVVKPQKIAGNQGNIIGSINALGQALSYDNKNLGCVDILGKVRNKNGEIIAQEVSYSSVMGFDNHILGYVDFLGNIVSEIGTPIATIELNGSIKDKENNNVGSIFSYSVAFSDNNIYLGRVDDKGQILSDNGEILGQVNYDGSIITKEGKKGYALDDLYIYDNDQNTVGYIGKNGRVYSIMGEIKGSIYKGFALDKKQNIIGRGKRDYNILNQYMEVIGYLKLDGTVVDLKNAEIGQLGDNGKIVDAGGNIVGIANDLQYFHINNQQSEDEKDMSESKTAVNNEEIKNSDTIVNTQHKQLAPTINITTTDEKEENIEIIPEKNVSNENQVETIPEQKQKIGIAVTFGGEYLGDIQENGDVINEKGEVIGRQNSNKDIVSIDNQVIGSIKTENSKQKSKDWIKNVIKGTVVSPYDTGNEAVYVGAGGGIGPGGRYEPRRAQALAKLYELRRESLRGTQIIPATNYQEYTGWQEDWGNRQTSTLRVNMDNMITADKPIPAVIARSLTSLGSVPVTAIVERNIYGDSGRNIIIPAGSRIIGGLSSADGTSFNGMSGGVKINISWKRIIRPDGIQFDISSANTGDAGGRGGGALGYVDEQLLKKYTLPLIGTAVTSAITYIMATDEENNGNTENSKQQAASDAREEFKAKMENIFNEIMENKKQIQAVTYVPAGTRVIIYPMKDLWLRTTKDIITGVKASNGNVGVGDAEVLIDEANQPTLEGGVQGGGNQGPQLLFGDASGTTQNNGTALINEAPSNGGGGGRQPRGVPAPYADGVVTEYPDMDDNEEIEDLF